MQRCKINGGGGNKSLKAFTLAEVLITIVIIGVVAALTIPSVVVSYQKRQTATRLKKAYTTLSQAMNNSISRYGLVKNWEMEGENGNGETKAFVDKYVAPNLNVLKNCGYETTGKCEFKAARMDSPQSPETFDDTYYKLILSDGVSLYFQNYSDNYNMDGKTYPRKSLSVYVDTNGQNGPNVYGKDVFYYIYWVVNKASEATGNDVYARFIPNGYHSSRENFLSNYCNKQKSGKGCTGLIMIDNWEIKDDYPW